MLEKTGFDSVRVTVRESGMYCPLTLGRCPEPTIRSEVSGSSLHLLYASRAQMYDHIGAVMLRDRFTTWEGETALFSEPPV